MTQRGFVLLDVLLALAVLAIALPVLLGLANRDLELLAHARALTTATLLAQEKLLETEVEGFPPVGQVMGDFQAPSFDKTSERKYDQREAFRWAQRRSTPRRSRMCVRCASAFSGREAGQKKRWR